MIRFSSEPVRVTGVSVKDSFRSFFAVPASSDEGRESAVEYFLPRDAETPAEGQVLVIELGGVIDHDVAYDKQGKAFAARRTKHRVRALHDAQALAKAA